MTSAPTAPDDDARLAEIEARLATTRGERWSYNVENGVRIDEASGLWYHIPGGTEARQRFIAAAPDDVRYLLTALGERDERIAALEAENERWKREHEERMSIAECPFCGQVYQRLVHEVCPACHERYPDDED